MISLNFKFPENDNFQLVVGNDNTMKNLPQNDFKNIQEIPDIEIQSLRNDIIEKELKVEPFNCENNDDKDLSSDQTISLNEEDLPHAEKLSYEEADSSVIEETGSEYIEENKQNSTRVGGQGRPKTNKV